VYFAAPDFDRLSDLARPRSLGAIPGPLRTGLIPSAVVKPQNGDPTGCGDVWGATYFSRLLAGDKLVDAIHAAHRAAARNVEHRGATGLAHHLRGEIAAT
jgi:sugar/nucleoside kinase (ribokinase family)